MKDEERKGVLAAGIVICIIFIISGVVTIITSFIRQRQNMALLIFLLVSDFRDPFGSSSDLIFLFFLFFGFMDSPPIFAFFLIPLGVIILIVTTIIYKQSMGSGSYTYSFPSEKFKPRITYRTRPKREIKHLKCPACHAPLRKRTPCECEYCGTFIE